MTQINKRYLGIAILAIVVGVFKLFSKGIYKQNGEINLFNIMVPFGMGIGVLIFALIKIYGSKSE